MSILYGTTEYPNTFKRQAPFSLDKSAIYSSYSEAEEYAHHSPIAYNSQIISIQGDTKEDNDIYLLVPSDVDGHNFELLCLNVLFINQLKSKVGNWALTENIKDVTCTFNWDLLYPIDIKCWRVLINDIDVSGTLKVSESFITAPVLFQEEGAKITIIFEGENSDGTNYELFRAYAKTLHNTGLITTGIMTTFE